MVPALAAMSSSPPIYLDAHASTPVDPAVLAAMQPWWSEMHGNPHSSEHWFGWRAHRAVDDARSAVASLIGSDASEVVFTSGATEANNLALLGAARARRDTHSRIIVSAIEHKCVLESAAALRRRGWNIDVLPVGSDGLVSLDQLQGLLTGGTALVSVMAVNNETGVVQPTREIGRLCAEQDVWFHCDAAQAPAAVDIDVWRQDIDLLSLSAHKIYGPIGVGALYARQDILPRLHPVNFGGGQEQGIRSGTLSPPLCVGFGKACTLMAAQSEQERVRIAELRDLLWEGLCRLLPQVGLNGARHPRHPGNLNVCFPGCDAGVLLGRLQPDLGASTGSACTTGIPEPSHVLRAMGLSIEDAESSIRFGLGRFTTRHEVQRALILIADALKDMSGIAD